MSSDGKAGETEMADFAELRSLGLLIRRLEPSLDGAVLTLLAREHRDEIKEFLLAGLLSPGEKIATETASAEFANHLAVIRTGENKYTIARDHREAYISEINAYPCRITADTAGILVYHVDVPGVVHDVSRVLADHCINISKLNVSREHKGKQALLVSLTDEPIPERVLEAIRQLPQVTKVVSLP